jgi:hypothetical protein
MLRVRRRAPRTQPREEGSDDNQLPARAGHGSFTLAVTGIDQVVARAQELGIDTSERSSGEKVKTLMITDPDGNHIAFAEAIDKEMAR